jgi:hypothetical protein
MNVYNYIRLFLIPVFEIGRISGKSYRVSGKSYRIRYPAEYWIFKKVGLSGQIFGAPLLSMTIGYR